MLFTSNSHLHALTLIFVHSSHSTLTWSTEAAFFSSLRRHHIHKCTTSRFLSTDTARHKTQTRTPDQRPWPGNLFQPICAAVRVQLIVSCAGNVSQTLIGKSFEMLKSPLFSCCDFSLACCEMRCLHHSISCPFHCYPSSSLACFSLLVSLLEGLPCSWNVRTEVSISAGNVDTRTVVQLLQLEKDSKTSNRTVTQSKYCHQFLVDFMHGGTVNSHTTHHYTVSHMWVMLTTWWV